MKYLIYAAPLYLAIIILTYFNLLPGSTLLYGIISIVVAFSLAAMKTEGKFRLHNAWIFLAFLLILTTRVITYINNTIPLGYDTGTYKYAIEHPFDREMQIAVERGFGFPLAFLDLFLPISFILTYLLIGFELVLGFAVYKTVKEYFNKNIAILSLLVFSLSFVQLRVFTFMYYKNIIALSLLLFSFYFLKKNKQIPFILTASWLGSMHRPTFLLFGLSYLTYTIINYKVDLKKNIINGIIIIALTLFSYIGIIKDSLFPFLESAVGLEIGAGTFIGILEYQSLFLILLPFLFLGVYASIRNKSINILFIWFIFNLIFVSFKLIFFNRYIIHLDMIMLILAAIGVYLAIKKSKAIGTVSLAMIVLFSSYILIAYALNEKPLVSQAKLDEIQTLQNTEGMVMSTHKHDSPWLLGYSGRPTIAPGLYSYSKWSLAEWSIFWNSGNFTEVKPLLDMYEKPISIYAHPVTNREKFNNDCFRHPTQNIYTYIC